MSDTKNMEVNEPAMDYVANVEIPDGKIADYITGKYVKETEQEAVRQNFERTLVEEYQYPTTDIQVDYTIKVWDGDKQKNKKVPLVVMHHEKDEP